MRHVFTPLTVAYTGTLMSQYPCDVTTLVGCCAVAAARVPPPAAAAAAGSIWLVGAVDRPSLATWYIRDSQEGNLCKGGVGGLLLDLSHGSFSLLGV